MSGRKKGELILLCPIDKNYLFCVCSHGICLCSVPFRKESCFVFVLHFSLWFWSHWINQLVYRDLAFPKPLCNLSVFIIITPSLMDQQVLSNTREWKCVPQGLRMPGRDHFLGAVMSKLNASSPSTLKSHKKCYHCSRGLGTQLYLRNIEQRCAGRGEAGTELVWPLIHPSTQKRFTCMGRASQTLVCCFLRSWLGLCALSPLGTLAFALLQRFPPSSLFQFGLNAGTFLSVVYLSTPTVPPFLGNRKSSLPNPCLLIGLFHWDYNALSCEVLWKCKMVMSITIFLLMTPILSPVAPYFPNQQPFRDSELLFFLLWFMGTQYHVVVENLGPVHRFGSHFTTASPAVWWDGALWIWFPNSEQGC